MKKMYFFFLVFVFNVNSLFPQSYLDNYEGIPMITFGWVTSFTWLDAYHFNKVKEMGTDIFIPTDVIASKFDKYRLANLKLIPYQQFTRDSMVNYIAKYTEAAYSLWEAEGNDDAQGQIKLIPDLNYVDLDSGFAIKTKNNTAGYLFDGPHYLQPAKYTIFSSEDTAKIRKEVVKYTVSFKLKVEPNGGNFIPLANNMDNICRIEVFTGDTLLAADTIQAYNFISYGLWKEFQIAYSDTDNATLHTSHPVHPRKIYLGTQTVERTAFADVQFRVYFYGTSTNYLSLSVDNILASDGRGEELMNLSQPSSNILNQANNVGDINKFLYSGFDSTVVGWYAVDEPGFIDNWACVKKVKELIEENVPNKKLVTTIAGSWNGGIYRGNPDYDYSAFRIDELKKRTGLDEVIMNNFIYDYPYKDHGPYYRSDYKEVNIANMIDNHLAKLVSNNIRFSLALQTGKWHATESSHLLEKIPTRAQFLYTMNLGLLFGAKGICISNYFHKDIDSANTSALCSFDTAETTFVEQDLWYFIKDTISPRLKGLFGKTIKGLNQVAQKPDVNANTQTGSNINIDFVDKVVTVNNTPQLPCNFDVGTFNNPLDTDKKYFMAVNRYYSQWMNVRFTLRNLYIYKNWEVTNFVTNAKTTILTNTSNVAELTTVIPLGDAGLYSVLPIVKYGGTLAASDNISGSLQMGGNVIVPSGFTLTIAANSVINPNGFSIVSTGGTITIQSGATVNGAILKTGSTVKAIYPTMQAAISAAVSGQTVTVNIPQTVSGSFYSTVGSYIIFWFKCYRNI